MSALFDHFLDGYYGEFGGTYVPESLMPALAELAQAFSASQTDPAFQQRLTDLLQHYAGRPTPLYFAENLSAQWGVQVYLKREDLLHGGAHKTNNALGQAMLAKHMGKTRLIAETGAGQHGVATAMAGALLGLETVVYMGAVDMARQASNVARMQLMGAQVIPVSSGSQTLKDAINEAMRDWVSNLKTTAYALGTVAGPHPYPAMVRSFQAIIGTEARQQCLAQAGRLPTAVLACIGGGSNAIGIFSGFLPDVHAGQPIDLIGVEPAGHGLHTPYHGAVLGQGSPGILHGMRSMVMQTDEGQILETHSISAGLDYPSVGPEHAYLQAEGLARYVSMTDQQAIEGFQLLCEAEGIIPALESSHAIAYGQCWAREQERTQDDLVLINVSGRGDKDMPTVMTHLAESTGGA